MDRKDFLDSSTYCVCVLLDDARVFPVQVVIKIEHVLGGSRDLRMTIAHASTVFTHMYPEIPSSFTDVGLR